MFGSSALFGKIMLVKVVENNKIDAYFRTAGLEPSARARNRKKNTTNYFNNRSIKPGSAPDLIVLFDVLMVQRINKKLQSIHITKIKKEDQVHFLV